mgnify:CR=1 FL=1|jgi:hypothetical protein
MGDYTKYSKKLYRNIDQFNARRARSAKTVVIKGIKYRFQMMNLGKYEDKMKYGSFNWPVKFCTVGRKIPNPMERKETLVKEIHFDTLLRILKYTDWAKTPVFD